MSFGTLFLLAHLAIIALFFVAVGLGLRVASRVLGLPALISHQPTHSNSALHWRRRAAQIAFLLFLAMIPLLSVLRFDVASHQLIVLGRPWSLGLSHEVFEHASPREAVSLAGAILLKAILPWVTILSIFPILGFFTGRLFCGWLCPEGTLFELADFFTQKILGRRTLLADPKSALILPRPTWASRIGFSLIGLVTFLALGLALGLVVASFFIAPSALFERVAHGDVSRPLAIGVGGVVLYIFITSILVRHVFCKVVCGAGMLQVLFSWASPVTMRLAFDRERGADCTNCRACEKVCFMNLNPRNLKRELSCVNCGECIAACRNELEPRGIQTLITFTTRPDKKAVPNGEVPRLRVPPGGKQEATDCPLAESHAGR